MRKAKLIIGFSIILLFLVISSIYIIPHNSNFAEHRDDKTKSEISIIETDKPKSSSIYNISIVSPEARDYNEAMSGYYSGSYSFDNDLVGAVPFNWVDESTGSCTTEVVDNWKGHKKVLKLTDNDGSGQFSLSHVFGNQTYSSIELYHEPTKNDISVLRLKNDNNQTLIQIAFWAGSIVWDAPGFPAYANGVLHHLRIDFD